MNFFKKSKLNEDAKKFAEEQFFGLKDRWSSIERKIQDLYPDLKKADISEIKDGIKEKINLLENLLER